MARSVGALESELQLVIDEAAARRLQLEALERTREDSTRARNALVESREREQSALISKQ